MKCKGSGFEIEPRYGEEWGAVGDKGGVVEGDDGVEDAKDTLSSLSAGFAWWTVRFGSDDLGERKGDTDRFGLPRAECEGDAGGGIKKLSLPMESELIGTAGDGGFFSGVRRGKSASLTYN